MRKVFENSMVGHLWANASQSEARSGNGNLWFEGAVIWSYRTPIAQRLPGGRTFLVTSERYSVTTSGKHMPAVWRAIPSNATLYQVPFVCPKSATEHAANVKHLREAYAAALRRYMRGNRYPEVHHGLTGYADALRGYAGEFGVHVSDFPDPDIDAQAVAKAWAEMAARDADPAVIAKRERARIKRAERKEKAVSERAAKAFAEQEERRAKWLAGSGSVGWHLSDANGGALLRVKGDTLQTSHGADVPLAHAVKAFRMVKHCRDTGTAWQRNGHAIRVGHFQVDRIDAGGNMVAGCHRINWLEIERIARAVGVFDADVSDVSDVTEPSGEAHATA